MLFSKIFKYRFAVMSPSESEYPCCWCLLVSELDKLKECCTLDLHKCSASVFIQIFMLLLSFCLTLRASVLLYDQIFADQIFTLLTSCCYSFSAAVQIFALLYDQNFVVLICFTFRSCCFVQSLVLVLLF